MFASKIVPLELGVFDCDYTIKLPVGEFPTYIRTYYIHQTIYYILTQLVHSFTSQNKV